MLPDLPPSPPPSLDQVQVQSLSTATGGVSPEVLKEIGPTRAAQLRELAVGVGARAGLERRSYEIQKTLRERSRELDAIFNFQSLMLDNNVLPPVLLEAENQFQQDSGEAIRLVDKVYRVHAQARFVSAPPNWREYVVRDFTVQGISQDVPAAMLPSNDKETAAWKTWVAEGWKAGLSQAETIHAEGLSRLRRDYEGMVRYRVLYAKGMVSRPFVARSDFGVTGAAGELNVNETTLRITAMPSFNLNVATWRGKAEPAAEPQAAKPESARRSLFGGGK